MNRLDLIKEKIENNEDISFDKNLYAKKVYKFLSDEELPNDLNFNNGGNISSEKYICAYKELNEADVISLSLFEKPCAFVLEIDCPKDIDLIEFGDSVVFPKNQKFNITSTSQINLPERNIIKLSVTPDPTAPSALSPVPEKKLTNEPTSEEEQGVPLFDKYKAELFGLLHNAGTELYQNHPVLHKLENAPEEDLVPYTHLTPTDPKIQRLYRVDLSTDNNGFPVMKWGKADPRDVHDMPNKSTKKLLLTHKNLGEAVDEDIFHLIQLGRGGDLGKLMQEPFLSRAYVNLDPTHRIQGYGLLPKDKDIEKQPMSDKELLDHFINTNTSHYLDNIFRVRGREEKEWVNKYTKGRKGRLSKDELMKYPPRPKKHAEINLGPKELDNLAIDILKDYHLSRGENEFSAINRLKDQNMRNYLHNEINKQIKLKNNPKVSLYPEENKSRGKWETFDHPANEAASLVQEESVLRNLAMRVNYNGKLGSRLNHMLDFIKSVEPKHNKNYELSLKKLEEEEKKLKDIAHTPNILSDPLKLNELTRQARNYLSAQNQMVQYKKIRDGFNVFSLISLFGGIRPQFNASKNDEEKTGIARLRPKHIQFDDKKKKVILTFKGKEGPERHVTYSPYIYELLKRNSQQAINRAKYLNTLGDLIPKNVLDHIINSVAVGRKKDRENIAELFKSYNHTKALPEENRLFHINEYDFNNSIYGQPNMNDSDSSLRKMLKSFTDSKGNPIFPDPKDIDKYSTINSRVLRKWNVNVMATILGRLEGYKLFKTIHDVNKIRGSNIRQYLNNQDLAERDKILRKRLALITGHSPLASENYTIPEVFRQSIREGFRHAHNYYKKHGKLYTLKQYRKHLLK